MNRTPQGRCGFPLSSALLPSNRIPSHQYFILDSHTNEISGLHRNYRNIGTILDGSIGKGNEDSEEGVVLRTTGYEPRQVKGRTVCCLCWWHLLVLNPHQLSIVTVRELSTTFVISLSG